MPPTKRRTSANYALDSRPVKRRKTKIVEEPVWAARAILREDKTRYLVDWEDDVRTGEAYPPEWVSGRGSLTMRTEPAACDMETVHVTRGSWLPTDMLPDPKGQRQRRTNR